MCHQNRAQINSFKFDRCVFNIHCFTLSSGSVNFVVIHLVRNYKLWKSFLVLDGISYQTCYHCLHKYLSFCKVIWKLVLLFFFQLQNFCHPMQRFQYYFLILVLVLYHFFCLHIINLHSLKTIYIQYFFSLFFYSASIANAEGTSISPFLLTFHIEPK